MKGTWIKKAAEDQANLNEEYFVTKSEAGDFFCFHCSRALRIH